MGEAAFYRAEWWTSMRRNVYGKEDTDTDMGLHFWRSSCDNVFIEPQNGDRGAALHQIQRTSLGLLMSDTGVADREICG